METKNGNYYVFIVTNKDKTELQTGVAGALSVELYQREFNTGPLAANNDSECIYLIYWEKHTDVIHAFEREKEIIKLSTKKKGELINTTNPEWRFLNNEIYERGR